MARIRDASVEAVKAAADMVEVVSARTALRRASSARFTGRCPFHEERTPSFSVDPVGKLYYCFGCGKGGDVVRFVQETENLDFAGAIEWLADRFRVTLEYEETSPRQDAARRRRERLTSLLEQTTAYFERVLWESEAAAPVREYLATRALGEEIAKEFRLGLSQGAGLVAKARERGFTPDEIRAAGLANRRGNDYFPFRLMFPLADPRGRIVGFQARKLREIVRRSLAFHRGIGGDDQLLHLAFGQARGQPVQAEFARTDAVQRTQAPLQDEVQAAIAGGLLDRQPVRRRLHHAQQVRVARAAGAGGA